MTRRLGALVVAGLWCLRAAVSVASAESMLVIGSAEFPQTLNAVTAHDPVSTIVRRAVTAPLAALSGGGSRVSDGVRVSEDGSEWRFRLAPLVQFHSGAIVRAADVLFSLRRCPALLQRWQVDQETLEGRDWVRFRAFGGGASVSSTLPEQLSECPILEQRTAEIFGPALGAGANLVSLGEYQISGYRQGREVRLSRQRKFGSARRGVPEIVVQSVPSDEHALTALQAGTLDVVVTASASTVERAVADPTLTSSKCDGRFLIHRTRLAFSCNPISASEYVG